MKQIFRHFWETACECLYMYDRCLFRIGIICFLSVVLYWNNDVSKSIPLFHTSSADAIAVSKTEDSCLAVDVVKKKSGCLGHAVDFI